ncbi:Protein kinase C and casein kinase substrate in neurons protein 1 [Lamellibrachia satsuma]|nr:Protein kinase C and casein kinase substrate in neurons protein 1 [Lamellibrachia satsuma]
MEEMMEVFQRSQDAEEKRLCFFKETFFSLHRTLDVSANEQIPRLYEQFRLKVELADHDKDLKFWSNNHGVDMPMYWPTFEEYSPDMHSILRREKKGSNSDGVTLTSINRSETNAEPVAPSTTNIYNTTPEPSESTALTKQKSYDASLNPFADGPRNVSEVTDGSPCHSGAPSTEKLLPQLSCNERTVYQYTIPARFHSPPPSLALLAGRHSMFCGAHTLCENYDRSLNPFGDDEEDGGGGGDVPSVVEGREDARPPRPQRKPRRHNPDSNPNSGDQQAQNPFGDDDDHWDNYDNPMIDDGGDGVPIRALYDYEGEEEDELSFKVGDVFVKLQDKDEQGWCKGRKDGRVGLFPDNYTEVISQ